MGSAIILDTYADSYNGINNLTAEDLDDMMLVFSVPVKWAKDFIKNYWNITLDEFMDTDKGTYSWDKTLVLYDHAVYKNVVLAEELEWR